VSGSPCIRNNVTQASLFRDSFVVEKKKIAMRNVYKKPYNEFRFVDFFLVSVVSMLQYKIVVGCVFFRI
jgi:hypothetical protein